MNRVQYGSARLEDQLGAADYSLIAQGRSNLFTFCMCAGGHIIPSVSEPGYFSTNGMSLSRRNSPYANSGLMVTLEPEQFGGSDVLAGIELQAVYEQKAFVAGRGNYLCPIQTAKDFLAQRPSRDLPACSYARGAVLAMITELVPPVIVEALYDGLPIMDRRWQGRFWLRPRWPAPKTHGSAPVRMVRDDISRETPGMEGLYPVGEGAGYAGRDL